VIIKSANFSNRLEALLLAREEFTQLRQRNEKCSTQTRK
jgi:hypothetical protein